jgi:hypothetical protein
MSFIKVTPDDLVATAGRVRQAMTAAEEARSKNGSLESDAASAGRADVEHAIRDFTSAWSYGLQCLSQDAGTLASFLELAGSTYEQVEQDIAQKAGP